METITFFPYTLYLSYPKPLKPVHVPFTLFLFELFCFSIRFITYLVRIILTILFDLYFNIKLDLNEDFDNNLWSYIRYQKGGKRKL